MKLLVVFVSLLIDLLSARAMAPQPDPLLGVRWRIQEEGEWNSIRIDTSDNIAGTKVATPQQKTADDQQGSSDIAPVVSNERQAPYTQPDAHQTSEKEKEGTCNSEGWKDLVPRVTALLTVFLLGFQAFNGVRTANAAKKSADTANKTLILTQRPKLRIRNVTVDPLPLGPGNPDHLFKDRATTVEVAFSLVNIGNAVAHLAKGDCIALFANHPLPMEPPYAEFPLPAITNISLQPGEIRRISLFIGQPLDDTPRMEDAQRSIRNIQFKRLYIIGYIDYTDELNLTRRTAFCRWLTADTLYLRAEDNPDYEYED